MEYRSSEIKAGLFIFISIIVLCAMIFILKDLKDIGKPKRTLEIHFENASGLTTGLPVSYAGIKIGRITSIVETDDEKYHVAAITEIDQAKLIFKKDRAYIKTEGLMGGPYIDIEPGPSSDPLPENVPLKGNPAFSFASIGTKLEKFGSLFDGMGDLDLGGTLNSMKKTFENANVILEENRQPIAKSIDNIRLASGNLNEVFNKKNRETFAATLENFKEAAGRVSEALNENNREAFAVALRNFGDATGNLRDALNQANQDAFAATLRNLETVSANANGILVENRQPIADSVNNMKGAFKTANTILEENRQPISDSVNNIKGTFQTATDILDENRQPIKDSVNSMNGAFKTADSILQENRQPINQGIKNFRDAAGNMSKTLNKENREALTVTLKNVAGASKTLDEILVENKENIKAITDRTKNVTSKLDVMLSKNGEVKELLASVRTQVEAVGGKAVTALDDLDIILIENRRNIREMMRNLKEASGHLEVFSHDLENNPWKLLKEKKEVPPGSKKRLVETEKEKLLREPRLDKVSNK